MATAVTLSQDIGKKPACEALDVSRATFYRHIMPTPEPAAERPAPPLSLTCEERQAVLDELHSGRFRNVAPLEVVATLLDDGCYLCSARTMYRILSAEHDAVKERRRHVQRPQYVKPELLATAPNQVWAADISVLQQREGRVAMT